MTFFFFHSQIIALAKFDSLYLCHRRCGAARSLHRSRSAYVQMISHLISILLLKSNNRVHQRGQETPTCKKRGGSKRGCVSVPKDHCGRCAGSVQCLVNQKKTDDLSSHALLFVQGDVAVCGIAYYRRGRRQ
ncbi:hypothetical protein NPIL_462561 [Nephila pilipes]|uniref:Uncharacterized protein n=1 Tax=Nephila pilipes TaxID=299642 RepID=A0A8X6UM74_NEPPI|nr:hypothetical protein NPIL_462561 [Nephila pilipes]